MCKKKVFVISPFNEDCLDLYEELKQTFKDEFDFTNAGDLDNQHNILKDIVLGIHNADVIIADLTGLNPNVFYELGLAHAINKKVIIITQNLDALPFDIRSYRANEYSLKFNQINKIKEELRKLLHGAVDGSVQYGNPVCDFIPNYLGGITRTAQSDNSIIDKLKENETRQDGDELVDDREFIDLISDIEISSKAMSVELGEMMSEMDEFKISVDKSFSEFDRVKRNSGFVSPSYAGKMLRKLSEPVIGFAGNMQSHIDKIDENWNTFENSFLTLMDNKYYKNMKNIKESMFSLDLLKNSIEGNLENFKNFITTLDELKGIERNFTNAISKLKGEFERFLTLTNTMQSSIGRIQSKGDIILDELGISN